MGARKTAQSVVLIETARVEKSLSPVGRTFILAVLTGAFGLTGASGRPGGSIGCKPSSGQIQLGTDRVLMCCATP